MRPLRTAGWVSEDHPLDAEHSSCGAIHLQTGRVPPRARRTASQLREGSYGRDLGTRPRDDSVGGGETLRNWRSFFLDITYKKHLETNRALMSERWAGSAGSFSGP